MRGLSRLAALLEAFLFVKGNPVTMEELVSTLGENPDEIEKALALLKRTDFKNLSKTDLLSM